jgi:hypothetical protein
VKHEDWWTDEQARAAWDKIVVPLMDSLQSVTNAVGRRILTLEAALAAAHEERDRLADENKFLRDAVKPLEWVEERFEKAEAELAAMREVVGAAVAAREAAKHYAPDQESGGFQNYIRALADTWTAVDRWLAAASASQPTTREREPVT